MQRILDKAVRFSRVRSCRLSFPALALGICALICFAQQAALGQAQVGSAESSFDEGPDKLPAISNTPIPPLRVAMPAQIAQAVLPARHRGSGPAMARPARAPAQDSHAKNLLSLRKRQPEGTLTAAR
jgi:hypothetical protein